MFVCKPHNFLQLSNLQNQGVFLTNNQNLYIPCLSTYIYPVYQPIYTLSINLYILSISLYIPCLSTYIYPVYQPIYTLSINLYIPCLSGYIYPVYQPVYTLSISLYIPCLSGLYSVYTANHQTMIYRARAIVKLLRY